MFGIGWSEFVVIGVVALIAIGPKELPSVLRAIGQWTGKIRRMASEFQDQFREAIREAEVADLKKDIDEAASKLNTDPFAGVNDSPEWKHSEPTASPVPAADAPPAPPAEAIAPVTAEAAPTEPAPADVPAPAPAEPAAAAASTTSAPKPPASGDQAA
jgi:sec-independent protein translocase protein TatB